MIRVHPLIVGAAVLLLAACGSNASTTRRDNIAYLYGKSSSSIQLDARVHHEDGERSTLYYKLPTRELLYKSDGSGGPFKAVVRLSYAIYSDWNAKVLLDSASVVIQDKSLDPSEEKELIGSIALKRTDDPSVLLHLTARDLNRETQSTVAFRVERSINDPRQYFLPIDPGNGLPRFLDHLNATHPGIRVRCEAFKGRALRGEYFKTRSGLPAPVFTTTTDPPLELVPDSTFTLQVDPEEGFFRFVPNGPGTYHFRPDSLDPRGYTVFVLDESFPYVGRSADMLRPLRYITSMQEYDRISKSDNVRKSIERFWLDAAGDRERAREAIRIYYGRVENANRHFSSQVEGWRTDRGLVHLIFGIPTSIYRSEQSETWIYGEENNLLSLNFTFVKRDSPFTGNDFVLNRDPALKGAWYRNVESWRNGRVYQN
jgi:GWxTD domain-containing protein